MSSRTVPRWLRQPGQPRRAKVVDTSRRFMTDEERLTEVFFDVHRGLPRQGIGSDEETRRALGLCTGLPESPDVLDVGCGPGAQTVVLARATGRRVTAVDLHEEFLDELAPLEAKLPGLFAKYAGDEPALAIVDSARREIELRRRYPDSFGYDFFVMRAGSAI